MAIHSRPRIRLPLGRSTRVVVSPASSRHLLIQWDAVVVDSAADVTRSGYERVIILPPAGSVESSRARSQRVATSKRLHIDGKTNDQWTPRPSAQQLRHNIDSCSSLILSGRLRICPLCTDAAICVINWRLSLSSPTAPKLPASASSLAIVQK